MRRSEPGRVLAILIFFALSLLAAGARAESTSNGQPPAKESNENTYQQSTILKETVGFFGEGAEGTAKVVAKVFSDLGRPNGYIKGQEASGAFVVGARYGDGTLVLKRVGEVKVHWTGPSVGFDAGGNVSKVFVLVYHMHRLDQIFQRFPAVEGSLYVVAGASVNYQQSGNVILAPIRLGAGWRAGVNLGYVHYRREKSWNPF